VLLYPSSILFIQLFTKTCTRHCHNETPNITKMTDIVGLDKRQKDVVILLTLVLVNCSDLMGATNQRVVGTPKKIQAHVIYELNHDNSSSNPPGIDNISEKVLLSIVSCEHGDFFSRIPQQPHVHE